MTDYPIRVTPAGYQVGVTTDGRDFAAIGPPHETPRAAIAYSDALSTAPTTPGGDETPPSRRHRGSPEGSTPARSATPVGAG